MKVNRKISNLIKLFLDNLFPAWLRDSKVFLWIPFKLQFNKQSDIYFNFRENAYNMTDREFAETYRNASGTLIHSGTDLNDKCFKRIVKDIMGDNILEVACGRGKLAMELSKKHRIVASDIIYNEAISRYPNIKFVLANIENLPFKNKSFDTVISTHTLEHTKDIFKAIKEIRRVCKKKLIVVLPKERPYKFGFNFHLHFFPYEFSIYSYFGKSKGSSLTNLDGDWYYTEAI